MNPSPDSRTKSYGPQRSRSLQVALAQRLGAEFPRLGGPRILRLCAEMIMEVVEQHLAGREHFRHGQVLWCAISADDRPRRRQTAADTRMVPVILSLHEASDLEGYLDRSRTWKQLRLERGLRLCREAHQQGGLLSNIDLSLLLGMGDSHIASLITKYERENDAVVPRRTTLHDMGSGVTHKGIICRKRHLEGKDPAQVARETWHTLESVDRYLGQYDRVRHCRRQQMSPLETAHILGCSERLVIEYLEIDDQINQARESGTAAGKRSKNNEPLS